MLYLMLDFVVLFYLEDLPIDVEDMLNSALGSVSFQTVWVKSLLTYDISYWFFDFRFIEPQQIFGKKTNCRVIFISQRISETA